MKNKDKSKENKINTKLDTLNVVWLYPDILNNYGDRGNIEAIVKMAERKNIDVNIIKVDGYKDEIPFDKANIIILGSGELRVMPKIIERLQKDMDALNDYINNNNYLFVFNLTASIFAKETIRQSGETFKGLNLLPLTVREKRYNYGDDLDLTIYNGMEIMGSQIQLADYLLDEGSKYFGDVRYGYGNDFYSKKAGARYKNLIFPNIQGPLFFKNPWYLEYILNDIINGLNNSEDYIKDFDLDSYEDEYPLEVKGVKAAKKFIQTKARPTKKEYETEYLL